MRPKNMTDTSAMAIMFVLGCTNNAANTIAAEQINTMTEMMN